MKAAVRPVVALVVVLGAVAVHAPGASAQVDAAGAKAPAAAVGAQATPVAVRAPDQASVRVERQITRLHKQLAITEAQTPQWTAFADIMRANAQHIDALYQQRQQGAATRSAVDDMASYAALAKAHSDDVSRLMPPFANLYAAMSDTQKKTADSVFRRAEDTHATRAPRG